MNWNLLPLVDFFAEALNFSTDYSNDVNVSAHKLGINVCQMLIAWYICLQLGQTPQFLRACSHCARRVAMLLRGASRGVALRDVNIVMLTI
jgi:hypothetical protein